MRTPLFVLTGMIAAAAVHAVGPPAAISTVKPAPAPAVAPATPPAPAKEAPPMEDASMTMMGMAAGTAALPKDQVDFFEKKIRPILAESCYKCHSTESGKSKGGLLLDNREVTLKGGENGAAVKPGDPAHSLLITAVSYLDKELQMPPKGDKLSDAQIADLTAWVKMGAPDPRSTPDKKGKLSGLTEKARKHWAYQPVTRPPVPVVQNKAWGATPIDAFILQKLEEKKMAPSKMADPATLLRRATYDLTGLPPTLEEYKAFILDPSPAAFSKVIDRLLASPHYGERWGRFWLDSARYADTTGDRQNNNNQDYRFPYAWTYRDYVVRSFNEDKPYNRFIVEQLAADKLTDLKDPRDLAALGLLTVGSRLGSANDIINDRIDVVSKGFLGMTVVCARCHDHMFDPIPTKDYYALHGIFASTVEPKEKPIISGVANKKQHEDFQKKIAALEQENRDAYYSVVEENNQLFRQKAAAYITVGYLGRGNNSEENQKRAIALRTSENLAAPLSQFMEGRVRGNDSIFLPLKRFAEGGDNWKATTASIVENKDKKINPLVAAAFYGTEPKNFDDVAAVYGKLFASIDGKGKEFIRSNAQAKLPADKVTGFEAPMMELLQVPFRVSLASTLNSESIIRESNGWPLQIRGQAKFVFARINETLLTDPGADTRAMVVEDAKQPMDSPVFIRGEAGSRGDIVPRRFLEVLSGGKPMPFKQGSGRLELANAIANKNNPLTARVIVNRVWLHHFGEGFVRTPDDLGTQSEAPSHPELVDYLSSYLMDQGWSLKKLHKLIMLSKVYQESSFTIKEHAEIDPFNRLLWRANVRRLEFEAVRDSLLVFSGQLDRTVGGQPVNLADEPYSFRRSVYGYIDRGNVPELMSHFDFSNPDMPNSKRSTTIVPQQALFLMNSPMAVDITRRILARPEVAHARNNAQRIIELYNIILQRDPTAKTPETSEFELGYSFVGREMKEEPKMMVEAKAITDKAAARAAEREKNNKMNMNRSDATRSIRNDGEYVARKPLTPWETYAQALLFSNEAAYVN